jgi:hypothetical protein
LAATIAAVKAEDVTSANGIAKALNARSSAITTAANFLHVR